MTESKELVTVQPSSVRSLEASTFDRLQTVKDVLAPDLSQSELELFAMVAVRSGLDPFARQIFAVKRAGKMSIQTGIDGYRSIADRTGLYDGQDEPIFGESCPCNAKPQPHPVSATVRVYRKDMSRSVAATAYWHEYVPGEAFMWTKMPHVMLAKVAEALALRKTFPWDPNRGTGIGADLYTVEEMEQAGPPAPVVSVQERVAARASGLGVDLRTFAGAVSTMDPETVRTVRSAMFPEATGVSSLTDEQRALLLARLQGEEEVPTEDAAPTPDDGSPLGAQGEATDPEVIEGEVREIDEEIQVAETREIPEIPEEVEVEAVACEAASPFTEGAICLLPKRHRGNHRSSDQESWSR